MYIYIQIANIHDNSHDNITISTKGTSMLGDINFF